MMEISELTREVDASENAQQVMRELLSFIEDAAAYIAARSRGQTMATPERRRLREDIEKAMRDYIVATVRPETAKAYASTPADMVEAMLRQSSVPTGLVMPKAATIRAGKGAEAVQ